MAFKSEKKKDGQQKEKEETSLSDVQDFRVHRMHYPSFHDLTRLKRAFKLQFREQWGADI